MLAAIADTHGTDDHRLTGRTRAAVEGADHVVHAGDFTTEAVLDAVADVAGTLTAVYGNNDGPAVRERLTDVATLRWQDQTVAVVHGHDHSETALGLLARQEAADLVVVGHSHRPEIRHLDGTVVVNPGSYADPRRYRPAHAELDADGERIRARLRSPDGTTFSTVTWER